MNKKILVTAGVVVLVVGGGIGGFLLTKGDDKNTNTETRSENARTDSEQQGQETAQPSFSPIANTNESFEATITETGSTGYAVKLLYDGKGNSMYDGQSGSDKFTMYKLGNEFISCSAGSCFKLPDGNAGAATVEESQYSFSEDNIGSYKEKAVHQGTEKCGNQTCDKWLAKTGDFTGTFYVDQQQRIQKVAGESDGKKWTVVFDYKPVTIQRPANVQEFPMR